MPLKTAWRLHPRVLKRKKENQADVAKSLNFYGDKIHELENKLKSIETFDKKLSTVNLEINALKNDNVKIRGEINHLQQLMKLNELDIVRVSESRNENVLEVIESCIIEKKF
ncbi:hypothetical protein HHI36_004497 [Cryptolaemus montrouzieri]|uniref:Uncharacterized protein n=1 Tax=Cryptolaemus montrouzieri TaxID=559131 RepID=A0ABD2NRR5_9CUCU